MQDCCLDENELRLIVLCQYDDDDDDVLVVVDDAVYCRCTC